jgi:hypothetical protein
MKIIENDTPIIKATKKSKFAVICAVIFILLGVLLVYMEVRGDQNPLRIGAYVFLLLGDCYWIFPVRTSSQVIIRQLVSLFLLGALFASCLFALFIILGRGHEIGAPQEVLLIVILLTIAFTILTLIASIIVGVRIYKKNEKENI